MDNKSSSKNRNPIEDPDIEFRFDAPWYWNMDNCPDPTRSKANQQILDYSIRRGYNYDDPRDVEELMDFSRRLYDAWSSTGNLPNLVRGVPRDRTYRVLIRRGLQEMKYWQICRDLGFPTSPHFVEITAAGYISYSDGSLEQIQTLTRAVRAAGYTPSRKLKNSIK